MSCENAVFADSGAFMDFFGIQNILQVVGKKTGEFLSDSAYSEWSIKADTSVVDKKKAMRRK